jgi:hypothetical protein
MKYALGMTVVGWQAGDVFAVLVLSFTAHFFAVLFAHWAVPERIQCKTGRLAPVPLESGGRCILDGVVYNLSHTQLDLLL